MKLTKMILAFLMLVGLAQADVHSNMAETKLSAELWGNEGNQGAQLDALIKKSEKIGYSVVQANKNIQVHYQNMFNEKTLEMISFYGLVNKEALRPLFLKNPDFGAYAPFNFFGYKTLDKEKDDNTWYGHLAPETMLDIIGETDADTRKEFKAMINSFDTLVENEMKPTKSKRFDHTMPLPTNGLTRMVKKFERKYDI